MEYTLITGASSGRLLWVFAWTDGIVYAVGAYGRQENSVV